MLASRPIAHLVCIVMALSVLVVDGDTVEWSGMRWRVDGIDTPEINHSRCLAERQLGIVAAARLIELLRERGGRVEPTPNKRGGTKSCGFGRKCGRLFVGDEDWAVIAARERLGVPYDGKGTRHDWCRSPS